MIYLGADHRGYQLKEKIKTWLLEQKIELEDLGNTRLDKEDDYPDFAKAVSEKVVAHPDSFGILICGSGAGMDITANRVVGVRCVLGFDSYQVKMARSNDDVNILSLAADFISEEMAKKLISVFLKTPFSFGEKHQRRIEKIDQ